MGDADQRHRPFSHCLAVQVGDAVLGHHVVHIAAGGDDAGPFLQERHNPARFLPFGSLAVLGMAMTGLPRLAIAAPRMKSA